MPEHGSLVWAFDRAFGERRVVSRSDVLYLSGWCFHPEGRIRRLELLIAGEAHLVSHAGIPRQDVLHDQVCRGLDPAGNSLFSGFWTTVPVTCPEEGRRVPCGFRATLSDGRTVSGAIGELDLLAVCRQTSRATEPLVAICMATYDPPLDLLEAQMDSLVRQSWGRWVCLVNDDASEPTLFAGIDGLAARDPRFRVERNSRRLGYYRNFERCLERVPADASHVAFCDQDDLWYPEKLAESLAAFAPDVSLAYCDMHIVDRAGNRIADSYWTHRRNNYTDFSALIFANTITGAASVFRAELLDLALPLPEAVGGAFHDHWVACVALAMGRIAYVDKPLYAYRQHAGNVIGHYTGPPRRPIALRFSLRDRLGIVRQGYGLLMRTAVFARTLQARLSDRVSVAKRVVIARLAGLEGSLWPVLGEAARARLNRRPTLGMEWLCLQGAVGTKLVRAWEWLRRARSRPA